MRIGRRVNKKIAGDQGISLVELIVVISIMAVMVGITSLGVSFMFTKDAAYVASRIDDELSETRMLSMSRDGRYTFELRIHTGDYSKESVIEIQKDGSEYKTVLLDKNVKITVTGDGSEVVGAGETFIVEFDKSKGCVKAVNGSDDDIKGVYSIEVQSEKNTSKIKDITLISGTGRHFTEE